jgi:RNA polymerase sigma-70 factor (ECF subfamily)
MPTTSFTLLQKLRDPNDAAAWDRFVELYLPLLFFWARKLPAAGADPADLVHDVFVKLMQELPKSSYDPAFGGFRSWLRSVCQNHWRDHRRKRAHHVVQADDAQLEALAAADDGLERFWNEDYNSLLACAAFRLLEGEFDPITRAAFVEVVLNDCPVTEVARQFGLTPNAISMRKFRVVRRLRQELAEFLE